MSLLSFLLYNTVYIFAVTVLMALMEFIAEAIAEGIAHIIATIFTVLIGGFVSALISALTGRRVAMPDVSAVRMRNRNTPKNSDTATVPRELKDPAALLYMYTRMFVGSCLATKIVVGKLIAGYMYMYMMAVGHHKVVLL